MKQPENEDARLLAQPGIQNKGLIPFSTPKSTPSRRCRQAVAALRLASDLAKAAGDVIGIRPVRKQMLTARQSPHIIPLRQQVEAAEPSGNYEAFWQTCRAFLLERAWFYCGIKG